MGLWVSFFLAPALNGWGFLRFFFLFKLSTPVNRMGNGPYTIRVVAGLRGSMYLGSGSLASALFSISSEPEFTVIAGHFTHPLKSKNARKNIKLVIADTP